MCPLWEDAGLKTIYVGDEAVVHPDAFSLEGRAVRKVRQSVNRLQRLGFQAEIRQAGELDAATLDEIVEVSEIWKEGQPERGFSMAIDDVRSTELEDTVFVIGRDPEGKVAGFLHFVPVPATGDLSLSAMRRQAGDAQRLQRVPRELGAVLGEGPRRGAASRSTSPCSAASFATRARPP